MKITFVLSSLRLSGGVILVVEISNRLAERGHEVVLLTPCHATDKEIVERMNPDVAVCETSVGLPSPTVTSVVQQARLVAAFVLNTPRCDVLIATHTPTTLPVLLSSWRRSTKRLWLYMDYPEMFRSRRVEHFLLTQMPGCFPDIVTISKPLADQISQISSGCKSAVHIMQPGLGLAATQSNIAKLDNRLRVLYVGDDRQRKGLHEFVKAMETVQRVFPSALAVVVCKNPCQVPSHLLHEIHIRPDSTTLARLYQECDIFVSTSWGEGLGYPSLEAMAFGKPAIVADSIGVRDYVVDGVNAVLVPAQSADAVADALVRLIHDESLRNRLGANGRRTAASYDWETATTQFEDVLHRVTRR